MTEKWRKQFDEEFWVENATNDWGSTPTPKAIKSFILKNRQELVESILVEIPNAFIENPDGTVEYTKEIKKLIRDKYGNRKE